MAEYNVLNYGLVGDYRPLSGLSIDITVSNVTLNSVANLFSLSDVGKSIFVYGAGPNGTTAGDELEAIVASYVSPTEVILGTPATYSVTGAEGGLGTNNTLPLNALLNSITDKKNLVIFFPDQLHFYFKSDVAVLINGFSKTIFRGNGASLYFISSKPGSYPSGTGIRNLFMPSACNNITFEGFLFYNVGQRQSRLGTSTEPGYYDTLNGNPVTYDRRYNKQANTGACIYNIDSTYTSVKNCYSYEVGCFYNSTHGTNKEQEAGGVLSGNIIEGYAVTAIFGTKDKIIINNIISNTLAPVASSTDMELPNLKGTSHAIYVTGGHDNIIISNNIIKDCRGWALQYNTTFSGSSNGNICSNNEFINCFTVGLVTGGESSKDLTFNNNVIRNSGGLQLDHPNLRFSASSNLWIGVLDGLGSGYIQQMLYVNSAKSVLVNGDNFSNIISSDPGTIDNACFHIADNANIGKVTIENCIALEGNDRFIKLDSGMLSFAGCLTFMNNTIACPSRLFLSAAYDFTNNLTSKIIFKNNLFISSSLTGDPLININVNAGISILNNIFKIQSTYYSAIIVSGTYNSSYIHDNIIIMNNNIFYNEGSDSAYQFIPTSAPSRVEFISNQIYGSINLNAPVASYRNKRGNYYSANGTWDF